MVAYFLEYGGEISALLGGGIVVLAIISGTVSYFPSKNRKNDVRKINNTLLILYLLDVSLLGLIWQYEALHEYDNLNASPFSFSFFVRVFFLSIPGVLIFKFNTFMEPRMRKSWDEAETAFADAKQLHISQKIRESLNASKAKDKVD